MPHLRQPGWLVGQTSPVALRPRLTPGLHLSLPARRSIANRRRQGRESVGCRRAQAAGEQPRDSKATHQCADRTSARGLPLHWPSPKPRLPPSSSSRRRDSGALPHHPGRPHHRRRAKNATPRPRRAGAPRKVRRDDRLDRCCATVPTRTDPHQSALTPVRAYRTIGVLNRVAAPGGAPRSLRGGVRPRQLITSGQRRTRRHRSRPVTEGRVIASSVELVGCFSRNMWSGAPSLTSRTPSELLNRSLRALNAGASACSSHIAQVVVSAASQGGRS